MKVINRIGVVLIFMVLLYSCESNSKKEQAKSEKSTKPNIIIIIADDLGNGDVGYNGSAIKTPNIDRLAKEGVILNRFYVAPVCSPTRAGLMTGRYPNRFGLRETVIPPWRDFGVDTTEAFLPEILAKAGYENRTALGKWHLGHSRKAYHPLERGFTKFYGHYNGAIDYFTHKREGEIDWHYNYKTSYDKGYATDLITREAIKTIQDDAGESPFFLYVAYNAPHGPLQAKEEDLLLYGFDKNEPLFSTKTGYGEMGRGNTRRQTYAAMVTRMDQGIGEIMNTLEKLKIQDNTFILFLSDNGPAPNEGGTTAGLRGHKFQEWEGGVRVPAIVRWPNEIKGGREINQVMGYIDIVPTLKAMAGIKTVPTKKLDGLNMLPVLKGEKHSLKRDFYLGYGALVTNNWKLVKSNSGNNSMKVKEDVLFDMRKDQEETTDVKKDNNIIFNKLKKAVVHYDSINANIEVPAYHEGRKGFKAPKEWDINLYLK